jgi:hypothetical protein
MQRVPPRRRQPQRTHLSASPLLPCHQTQNLSCGPGDLYTAPVVKFVPADKSLMQQNLEQLSRQAQMLVLWLDCDREGENIGFEVLRVCTGANPRLTVKRARFSALIPRWARGRAGGRAAFVMC